MRGPCTLVPYITENGRSQVLEYLRDLERFDADSFAIYVYVKDLLILEGTDGQTTHWKRLGDGLGEVRWRNGKKRFRIYGSEESERRIFLAHAVEKDHRTFDNDDKAICLKRRAEFRSPTYSQERRQKLFAEKRNARNQ